MRSRVWWLIAFLAVAAGSAAPGIMWGDDDVDESVAVRPATAATIQDRDAIDGISVSWRTRDLRRACATQAERADVDGDGRFDRAFHAWIDDGPVLGVCLATGKVDAIVGAGMTEVFLVVDSNHDGRAELIYGGTSVCGGGGGFVVYDDGLREVHRPDGTPFGIEDGCAGPPEDRSAAWGCDTGQVVQVYAEPTTDGRTRWTREFVRIDGTTARTVREDSGTSEVPREWKFDVPGDVRPDPFSNCTVLSLG